MRRAGLVLLAALTLGATACDGSDTVEPTSTAEAAPTVARAQSIITGDGVRLSVHLFEANSDGRIVILSHQYGADQASWYEAAQRLNAREISALTFDFRGFGASGGEQDPEALATDLHAAVDYTHGLGYDRILLVGASMGGTASILVAGSSEVTAVDGVVTLSAPIEFGALEVGEAAASLSVPLMLIAGEGDTSAHDSLHQLTDAGHVPEANRLIVANAAHGTELFDSPEAPAVWGAIERFVEAIWPVEASSAGGPGY